MKIRIVIPMPSDVVLSKGTEASINALIKAFPEFVWDVKPVYGSCIWKNRNGGIKDFDFDYCLQVDNRKLFCVSDFSQLLSMNVGVASGWYYLPPENYASYCNLSKDKKPLYMYQEKEERVCSCDFFSTGFHLVNKYVYEKISKKCVEIYTLGHMQNGEHDGEDMGFCENLKLVNEKIHINKNVFIKREPLPFLKENDMLEQKETVGDANLKMYRITTELQTMFNKLVYSCEDIAVRKDTLEKENQALKSRIEELEQKIQDDHEEAMEKGA